MTIIKIIETNTTIVLITSYRINIYNLDLVNRYIITRKSLVLLVSRLLTVTINQYFYLE